jgi:hypothetical protein
MAQATYNLLTQEDCEQAGDPDGKFPIAFRDDGTPKGAHPQ